MSERWRGMEIERLRSNGFVHYLDCQLLGWIHLPNILKYRVYYIFSVYQSYHHKDIFKKRGWDNSKIFSTSESVLVAQSCCSVHVLFDPMDCSKPGSSVHRILLARILEWVAMPSSRGSSPPRDRTYIFDISCIGRQVLNH